MPRTEKTAREILEKLVYRTQNLMGRSQSEEIDQALLELQEVIVPEEEKGRFVVEAQDVRPNY